MKNLILLSLLVLGTSCFAQLPDLVGEKASIKLLEHTYKKFKVENGLLLDVGSYYDNDNIYLDAKISGESVEYNFELTSDKNGTIDYIYYGYDAIQEDHFNFLKSTIIKVHSATYYGMKDNATIYLSTSSGVTRYIFFERDTRGMAYVSFILK